MRENHKTISIKLINFKELKTKIKINLQLIEYISKENFKFGSKYSFIETIEGDSINIEIPTGKCVGTIELFSSKTIPFYKRYTGFNTIYFGINENRTKLDFHTDKCYPKAFYSYRMLNSLQNAIFCNDLKIDDKNYSFRFTAKDETNLNETRTIGLTYVGISTGLSEAFVYYPYAPFILISGFFGFTQNDIVINSEMLE
ncbi:hypothetical protein EHQ82_10965 [Leptospira selangorensis]|uniref:Uncharacterized protein n=2 Tax=Leptospira selangorensis TaxID=2484982 RepID=A0ABY2NAE7_9LEPT|nr:hypothetical protein EHQ82_10965 [Leptospira selangorensis]